MQLEQEVKWKQNGNYSNYSTFDNQQFSKEIDLIRQEHFEIETEGFKLAFGILGYKNEEIKLYFGGTGLQEASHQDQGQNNLDKIIHTFNKNCQDKQIFKTVTQKEDYFYFPLRNEEDADKFLSAVNASVKDYHDFSKVNDRIHELVFIKDKEEIIKNFKKNIDEEKYDSPACLDTHAKIKNFIDYPIVLRELKNYCADKDNYKAAYYFADKETAYYREKLNATQSNFALGRQTKKESLLTTPMNQFKPEPKPQSPRQSDQQEKDDNAELLKETVQNH